MLSAVLTGAQEHSPRAWSTNPWYQSAVQLTAKIGSRLPPVDLVARWADSLRSKHVAALLDDHPEQTIRCRRALERGYTDVRMLDTVADTMLKRLGRFGSTSVLSLGARRSRPEILDDPTLDPSRRHAAMTGLERVNAMSGTHELFSATIDRALGTNPSPHIYELAAGTGGLSRRAGPRLRRNRPGLQWTISDTQVGMLGLSSEGPKWLRGEYRDIFAGELSALPHLYLCVQAVHHMSPGEVMLLLRSGTRAHRGILVIDLQRGPLVAALAGLAGIVLGRNCIVAIDGVRSARRSFLPSELKLLAELSGLQIVDSGPLGAVHQFIHVVSRPPSPPHDPITAQI